ncbi:hypothetical protein H6F43_01245 [Leptolyngbya sp. FACHB-36]|uniref:hypothetical protein n=1 Tax=Leptolyngbya sp. FACHB-36 TaxID=2692808 RepID=UPI0016806E72|nr:hypothetical protein [Leptolyngbya sp. FACHB-36]MBD2018809.1 hypothetical protein [Leptolyngbya sp. FACHB-36]
MPNIRNVTSLSFSTLAAIAGLHGLGLPGLAVQAESTSPIGSKPDGTTQVMVAQAQPLGVAPASRVKIFLPRNPGQQNNLSHVEPVWRQPANSGVAQFAIGQVIAGPTQQEKQLGFSAPITLKGSSNCGKDFTLAITSGLARLQFCKQVASAGVGDDARAISSVNATLKQFPAIRSIVILDQNGNCLGDMSGQNRCLRR